MDAYIAVVSTVEEREILESEKRYWTLKALSKTGRFDLELFRSQVCPPLPEKLCECMSFFVKYLLPVLNIDILYLLSVCECIYFISLRVVCEYIYFMSHVVVCECIYFIKYIIELFVNVYVLQDTSLSCL